MQYLLLLVFSVLFIQNVWKSGIPQNHISNVKSFIGVLPLFSGFLIFVALWPWLWSHPIERLIEYVNYYFASYFSTNVLFRGNIESPSLALPLRMIFITTPIVLFILVADRLFSNGYEMA